LRYFYYFLFPLKGGVCLEKQETTLHDNNPIIVNDLGEEGTASKLEPGSGRESREADRRDPIMYWLMCFYLLYDRNAAASWLMKAEVNARSAIPR
jgi:hypothetical protein